MKTTLPHHIIKKSRTWYFDTIKNRHIHKDNLEAYLILHAPTPVADDKVRKARWDLNY